MASVKRSHIYQRADGQFYYTLSASHPDNPNLYARFRSEQPFPTRAEAQAAARRAIEEWHPVEWKSRPLP